MCKYCDVDNNESLIGNDYDYNDSLTIRDATLVMYSYDYRFNERVHKKPISYCPMCGRDLVEDVVNKLRSERQYE